jgi:nucleotide-binding universal stress UspA family protein
MYHTTVLPFRRMMVALAGRESDGGLLCYAAALARMLPGMETCAVHVAGAGSPPQTAIQQRVAAAIPGAELRVQEGDLLDTLLDSAAGGAFDLILLGHSANRRGRRSLARRLAMRAPCSIWLAPDGSPPLVSRILAPVDFSKRSADSLEIATVLAEAAGLDECLALHVYFNDAAATFDEFDEILVGEEEQAYSLFTAPMNLHSVFARPLFVESSSVARTILRVAGEQRADLIVMGTRGRSASAAVLLGSETEQVMMTASVPVLAVKNFGARRRLLNVLRDPRLHRGPGGRYS